MLSVVEKTVFARVALTECTLPESQYGFKTGIYPKKDLIFSVRVSPTGNFFYTRSIIIIIIRIIIIITIIIIIINILAGMAVV